METTPDLTAGVWRAEHVIAGRGEGGGGVGWELSIVGRLVRPYIPQISLHLFRRSAYDTVTSDLSPPALHPSIGRLPPALPQQRGILGSPGGYDVLSPGSAITHRLKMIATKQSRGPLGQQRNKRCCRRLTGSRCSRVV